MFSHHKITLSMMMLYLRRRFWWIGYLFGHFRVKASIVIWRWAVPCRFV